MTFAIIYILNFQWPSAALRSLALMKAEKGNEVKQTALY